MLTVAPCGPFQPHLLMSSDMEGRQILTCITADLAAWLAGYLAAWLGELLELLTAGCK